MRFCCITLTCTSSLGCGGCSAPALLCFQKHADPYLSCEEQAKNIFPSALSLSAVAITETFWSSPSGALYSDAALSAVTSHWLCLPAGLGSDHQRKRCLNFTCRLSVHGHRRFTYQPSAYLWHCCWYILFTAPVSEVWEPPSSASPIEHPPTAIAICAHIVLLGKGQIGTPFSGAISKFNVAILLPLISLLCSVLNYNEPMHV